MSENRRVKLKLATISLLAVAGTLAYAQQEMGSTSGPAAGINVIPSTVVQKMTGELQQGRSVGIELRVSPGAAGGLPGVEGMPGTESGRVPADAPDNAQ